MREAKNTIVKPTWICEVVTSTKQKMSHTGLKSDLVFFALIPLPLVPKSSQSLPTPSI